MRPWSSRDRSSKQDRCKDGEVTAPGHSRNMSPSDLKSPSFELTCQGDVPRPIGAFTRAMRAPGVQTLRKIASAIRAPCYNFLTWRAFSSIGCLSKAAVARAEASGEAAVDQARSPTADAAPGKSPGGDHRKTIKVRV